MKHAVGIAVAVSHLFDDERVRLRMAEFADAYELREHHGPAEFTTDRPVLFHADQSLLLPIDLASIERRVDAAAARGQLRLVSLHALSCYTEPRVEGRMFQPGGRRMNATEMIDHACRNAESLRTRFGHEVVVAVENNNQLPTPAYDVVAEPDFLQRVVSQARVALLLDLAHAAITAFRRGERLDDYVAALPLAHVVQVHLAGVGRHETGWTDDHTELSDDDWTAFTRTTARLPGLRFATLEYYADVNRLVAMHERLASIVGAPAARSSLTGTEELPA